jgi:hypothetical protein
MQINKPEQRKPLFLKRAATISEFWYQDMETMQYPNVNLLKINDGTTEYLFKRYRANSDGTCFWTDDFMVQPTWDYGNGEYINVSYVQTDIDLTITEIEVFSDGTSFTRIFKFEIVNARLIFSFTDSDGGGGILAEYNQINLTAEIIPVCDQ